MNLSSQQIESKALQASLWKRLAALLYDSLLIVAILFIATAILLPLHHGEAVSEEPLFHVLYQLYLLGWIYLFYAWFWRTSGQTLGMKAWRLQLIHVSGRQAGWGVSLLRLLAALLSWGALGLGYIWCLFSGKTWHDSISETRVIDLKRLQQQRSTKAD